MADIELVIKIPEEMYDWLDNGFPDEDDAEKLWQVVKNGTPLPKGHGDLIDVNYCIKQIDVAEQNKKQFNYNTLKDFIKVLPTIIEADTQNISEKEDIELE